MGTKKPKTFKKISDVIEEVTTPKLPLYRCKKCGFEARGVIGFWFNNDLHPELKDQMPTIKICSKCMYDWFVANLGELEVVKESAGSER